MFPDSTVGGSRSPHYPVHVLDDSATPDSPIKLNGRLLLADPGLRDGIFNRSVVLLADHSPEEGAFGLILNHPTGKTVGDFLKGKEFSPLRKLAVHHGGPVAPEQLTFSAFWWNKKSGLRWAIRVSREEAIEHAHRPSTLVRAFIGYSGWSGGQLENELRRNSWITVRPEADLLGHNHDRSLWSDTLRKLSPLHRILAEAPDDPLLN